MKPLSAWNLKLISVLEIPFSFPFLCLCVANSESTFSNTLKLCFHLENLFFWRQHISFISKNLRVFINSTAKSIDILREVGYNSIITLWWGFIMIISYKKLWILLIEKEISPAKMRKDLSIATGTMNRIICMTAPMFCLNPRRTALFSVRL